MYDSGGDGWQGATFQIFNSTSRAENLEGALLCSGELSDGFEGFEWICLENGCYEIVVAGGSAESEIGFEFRDEIGGDFQDLVAPYSDHFCVEDGDVFRHPTPAPSISTPPTKLPTPGPTSGFPTGLPTSAPSTAAPTRSPTNSPTSTPSESPTVPSPTGGPTRMPIQSPSQSPSALPTGGPTRMPTQSPSQSPSALPFPLPTTAPSNGRPSFSPTNPRPSLSVVFALSFAGLECTEYGAAEELSVKSGVASVLDGVETRHFGNTTCEANGRRRHLIAQDVTARRRLHGTSSAALVSLTLTISQSEIGGNISSNGDLADSVSGQLSQAISDGSVTQLISSAAAALNSSVSFAVTGHAMKTFAPTPVPTESFRPTPPPSVTLTAAPSEISTDDLEMALKIWQNHTPFVVGGVLLFAVCCCCVCYQCRCGERRKDKLNKADDEAPVSVIEMAAHKIEHNRQMESDRRKRAASGATEETKAQSTNPADITLNESNHNQQSLLADAGDWFGGVHVSRAAQNHQNWDEHHCEDTGRSFLCHRDTGMVQWEIPASAMQAMNGKKKEKRSSTKDLLKEKRASTIAEKSSTSAPTALGDDSVEHEWEVHLDETTRQSYFFHGPTGKTVWNLPEDVPAHKVKLAHAKFTSAAKHISLARAEKDNAFAAAVKTTVADNHTWIEHHDENHGRSYFHHVDTGKSSWELPPNTPPAAVRWKKIPIHQF